MRTATVYNFLLEANIMASIAILWCQGHKTLSGVNRY